MVVHEAAAAPREGLDDVAEARLTCSRPATAPGQRADVAGSDGRRYKEPARACRRRGRPAVFADLQAIGNRHVR